ncbi:hypothetical protein LA080_014422 [Diaporthe eres]|nr:hypothetical protein LA080_014422 [Diaporthe eres]
MRIRWTVGDRNDRLHQSFPCDVSFRVLGRSASDGRNSQATSNRTDFSRLSNAHFRQGHEEVTVAYARVPPSKAPDHHWSFPQITC